MKAFSTLKARPILVEPLQPLGDSTGNLPVRSDQEQSPSSEDCSDLFKSAHFVPLEGPIIPWSPAASRRDCMHVRLNSQRGEQSSDSSRLASEMSAEPTAGIIPVFYAEGSMFFLEGQAARGIFILRTGRAKESMVSSEGRSAILRVVGPGTILGLTAVLTGTCHESTVETLEPSHADFVREGPFRQLLKTSDWLNQMVARQLIDNCKQAYGAIRCLGVFCSAAERLARLLLQWAECPLANHNQLKGEIRIRVTFTQEEISQSVGSTRETTSRILGEFREKKWIAMNGSVWTIINEDALRQLATV